MECKEECRRKIEGNEMKIVATLNYYYYYYYYYSQVSQVWVAEKGVGREGVIQVIPRQVTATGER